MRLLSRGVALAALQWPLAAQAQSPPPHLTSFAAELHRLAAAGLERAGRDAESRGAAARALAALHRTGMGNWAQGPVTLPGAAGEAAALLGLDLTDEADAAYLRRLLAMTGEEVRAALAGRDPSLPDAELDQRVAALVALRTPPGFTTEHTMPLPDGESVTIRWEPETGRVIVRARSDGSAGQPEYDASLIGRTELVPDPETGNLKSEMRADETARAQVHSQGDLERLSASILGEWEQPGHAVYAISAADPEAGDIGAGGAADLRREIAEAEERIREIENAVVYVWIDPETGATERQERFRRLAEPWRYEGQRHTTENADREVTALRTRIAELQRRLENPPLAQHDPAGYEEMRGSATARPITIEVRYHDGYGYSYDEASFDGRKVSARRTLREVRDTNPGLPPWVRQGLIASWAPPEWLELEAEFEPATGAVMLSGKVWQLHVTYSDGMTGRSINSIHTPFSRSLALRRETRILTAQGGRWPDEGP